MRRPPPCFLRFSNFYFLFSILLISCGVPGPPVPPTPKIPIPPNDLASEQRGEQVVLRWTLPLLHTDGTRITSGQRVEIYRWFTESLENLRERFASEARLLYVVPEDSLEIFARDGGIEFVDPLRPRQLAQQAGRYAVYGIKALNRRNQDAGFSNLVTVRLHPIPAPIARIEGRVAEQAIELDWTPPERTTSGTQLGAIAGYCVYRSSGSGESWQLMATSPGPRFADTSFQFGETYRYLVRTLAQFDGDTVESGDSAILTVSPRDVFPPPPPSNLIAIATAGRVDLTWDASRAPDLAGYLVYRSDSPEGKYERLTPEPLTAQSFGDTQVAPGKTYSYVVTAVDREQNESVFSQPSAATVPAS